MNEVASPSPETGFPSDLPAAPVSLREMFTNAIRYWEPRRILYNAVLALVVLGHIPNFPMGLAEVFSSFNSVLVFFVLAVLANVCYCAAYVVDLFAQYSGLRTLWLEWRWIMLVLGLAFASTITHFLLMGLTH